MAARVKRRVSFTWVDTLTKEFTFHDWISSTKDFQLIWDLACVVEPRANDNLSSENAFSRHRVLRSRLFSAFDSLSFS